MAAIRTLKRYIEEADQVIQMNDDDSARAKIKGILAVFDNDYEGLRSGLNSYNIAGLMISNSGSTFDSRKVNHVEDLKRLRERLQMELDKMEENDSTNNLKRTKVFISHSSKDAPVAIMLKAYLIGCGIENKNIFCSSIPGNDVEQKIGTEVKENLQKAAVNIVILSDDYYKSPYCLNESGIIWYLDDVDVIVIAMPEICENNMLGFLNSENKLRRLYTVTDITQVYDIIRKAINTNEVDSTTVANEANRLIITYNDYLRSRGDKIGPNMVKNGQLYDYGDLDEE